jgi:dipeptidyl aminopeptidase/acylaminoacyl peptidase
MRTAIGISSLILLLGAAALAAENNKYDLSQAQIDDIIQKFAAKEAQFAKAREVYTYRQTARIQELDDNGAVTGRWETVSDIVFSPDGKRVVTASQDGTAIIWDAQTGQPVTEPLSHAGSVVSAEFSPDGTRIVTASMDDTARVWDAQTGRKLGEPMNHGEGVLSAEFSPDGNRIVTSSWNNTARVWDAQSGRLIAEPMQHSVVVISAKFSPDGLRILTGSHDRTARIWDAQTGQPLSEPFIHGGPLLSAEFSPDGKQIVTGSFNRKAHVWDVGPGPEKYPDWLLPLAEALSGQVLNAQAVLEETKLNRLETINQIRQRLNKEKDDNEWVRWGRWLLGDRTARTVSPFSRIPISEYIENQSKAKAAEPADRLNGKGPVASPK